MTGSLMALLDNDPVCCIFLCEFSYIPIMTPTSHVIYDYR